MGYFDGCVFCSVGFLRRSSFMWFTDIEAQGGTCSWTFDEHITHLVCSPTDVNSNPTVINAINSGTCWVVSEEFLEQCAAQGRRLNERDFLLAPAPKNPPSTSKAPKFADIAGALPVSPLSTNVSTVPPSSGYVDTIPPTSSSSSYVETQIPSGYVPFSFTPTSSPSSSRDTIPSTSSTSAGWPAPYASQKAQEDELRQRFAAGIDAPTNLYEHLVDIFGTNALAQPLPAVAAMPLIKAQGAASLSPVSTLSQFQNNWNDQTKNRLANLDWNNVFAAGGSVLSALTNCPESARGGDVDLFIYGLSPDAATRKLESIVNLLGGHGEVVRTRHAVTILGRYPAPHIQVVLRIYKSPAEVLIGFDIDSCCFGFNGQTVFALPRALRALRNHYNIVDLSRRSLSYEFRLWKYAKRGFAIAVPELDRSRVDSGLYDPNRKATGLAKLLLLEWKAHFVQSGPSKTNLFGLSKDEQASLLPKGESDYDLSVLIPYGPLWTPQAITRFLLRKAQANFFARKARHASTAGHLVLIGWPSVLSGQQSTLEPVGPPPTDPYLVHGPLSWLTQNPGQQGLLTGSFHPLPAEGWFTEAYASYGGTPGVIPEAPRSSKQPVSKKSVFGVSAKSTAPKLAKPLKLKPVKAVKATKIAKPVKTKMPVKVAQPSKVAQPFSTKAFAAPKKALPAKVSSEAWGASSSTGGTGWGVPSKNSTPSSAGGSAWGGPSAGGSAWGGPSAGGSDWGGPSAGGSDWGGPSGGSDWGGPSGGSDWGGPSKGGSDWGGPSKGGSAWGGPTSTGPAVSQSTGSPGPAVSQSTGSPGPAAPQTPLGKLLLLVSMLAKGSFITEQQRSQIKTKIIQQDENCMCALEVFEMDQDFAELADTLIRIISL